MARFIYLADTHLGADPAMYWQQPSYPGRLPELLGLLDEWIRDDGDIDFVLHGGDMVDAPTDENLRAAADLFRLSVPIYFTLGNHDLSNRDALARWLALAPDFFPEGRPEFAIHSPGCSVHVRTTHWGYVPYYWNGEMNAHFVPDQLDNLGDVIARAPGSVHLFATHSPAVAIPSEQTGATEFDHCPGEGFTNTMLRICDQHPQVRCLLGAHNHVNVCVPRGAAHCVTVSAFTETPFEFKLIEAKPGRLKMSTVSLLSRVGFEAEYDSDKGFVHGRECDRAFDARFE